MDVIFIENPRQTPEDTIAYVARESAVSDFECFKHCTQLRCYGELKFITSIFLPLFVFSLGPSLTRAKNQIQMAPARLTC